LSTFFESDLSQGVLVEVHPELFLVFPDLQKTTETDLHLITAGNFSTFATRWKNHSLFNFGTYTNVKPLQ